MLKKHYQFRNDLSAWGIFVRAVGAPPTEGILVRKVNNILFFANTDW